LVFAILQCSDNNWKQHLEFLALPPPVRHSFINDYSLSSGE